MHTMPEKWQEMETMLEINWYIFLILHRILEFYIPIR